jgi:hypothetical protein
VTGEFQDLAGLRTKLRPDTGQDPLSKYLYENLSASTQRLVCARGDESLLRRGLAKDLNGLLERELSKPEYPLYVAGRFSQVALTDYLKDFIQQNPRSHTRIRLNRLLLEAAYP